MHSQRNLILLILLLTLLLITPAITPEVSAQSGDPIGDMFRLVNEFRADYGLYALQWDGQLAAAAQDQANWMSRTGIYSHTQTNGSTPLSRAQAAGYFGFVVENIVGGWQLTAREGLIWWINSPVHLNTLRTTRHVDVGIGYAQGLDQNFFALVAGTRTGEAPTVDDPADQPIPIQVAPIVISMPRDDGAIVHVVQQGQTAWAIAARYDVSLSELLSINGLTADSFVIPGDELFVRLPDGHVPPPTATPPSTHIVNEGESLWTIAVIYNLEISDLLWYNGLGPNDFIQPGDELVVRFEEGLQPPPTATPIMTHFVASGDTLFGIALRYGLTLDELLSLNGLQQDSVLQIGQELRLVPAPTSTPIPSPAATATQLPTATPAVGEAQAVAIAATSLPATSQTQVEPAVEVPTLESVDVASADDGENDGTPLLTVGVVLIVVLLLLSVVVLRRS